MKLDLMCRQSENSNSYLNLGKTRLLKEVQLQFTMSRHKLFEQMEAKIAAQGFFMLRDVPQLMRDHSFKWQQIIHQFLVTYHEAQIQRFDVLCDFVIEKEHNVVMGRASQRELDNGQIQSEKSSIAFCQNEIKQKNFVCLYNQQVPIEVIIDQLKHQRTLKNRKYKNILSNTIVKSQAHSNTKGQQQQQFSRLPKKTLRKSKPQPMEIQIAKKAPLRKLMLRSEQSENEQVRFQQTQQPQIALFSMAQSVRNQSKEKNPLENMQIQASKCESKLKENQDWLRESKISKSNSLEKQKGNKSKATLRVASKKQLSKEQVQKQSNFMSNWMKNKSQ